MSITEMDSAPTRSHFGHHDSTRVTMYTGDPYKGMEVYIQQGDAKMHYGVVQGSRTKEDKVVVDVLTTTRTINTVVALDLDHVKERK